MDLSLAACQIQYKWNRWNCPITDFLSKRSKPTYDRESAFVQAITIAALIYTVTKNCSRYNEISECLTCIDQPVGDSTFYCTITMDNDGERIINNVFDQFETPNRLDAQGYAEAHINRAGRAVR